MEMFIAGGTGFIGQALVKHFLSKGNTCTVIGRSDEKIKDTFGNEVTGLPWSELEEQSKEGIRRADVIINLAGANIGAQRWTDARREEILQSRIKPTQCLAGLCASLGVEAPILLNASAIGVYGLQENVAHGLPTPFTEDSPINFEQSPDFLAYVARQWELAIKPAEIAGVRVVKMRFGVVLGKGGVLAKLKLPYSLGLGGPIGSGKQPFSWIALPDLIGAIDFLLANDNLQGAINFVAPQSVSQREFADTFAKVLHRPGFIPTPAFMIKMLFGQMGEELLLRGQNVAPNLLLKSGFKFQFPELETALRFVLKNDL